MHSFVLLIVLNLGYGQKQVSFQEFSPLDKCNVAMTEVAKLGTDTVERLVCLPK